MAGRRRPPTSSSINDPATRYARGVVAGEILAGPYVRGACKRHLDDLERGPKRGLKWDEGEVERVLEYFRGVLTVERELLDEAGVTVSEAVPFMPEPSQAFILGSLFGWKNKLGHRRFRRGYIEEAKGNGKALALDTAIPTPGGWARMGELEVGGWVFGADGAQCRIVAATEVMYDRPCYAVSFSDGATIVADEQHLWSVASFNDRKGGYALRTTGEIAKTWRRSQSKHNHRVDVADRLGIDESSLLEARPLSMPRSIVGVEKVDSVPVRCIRVDSSDGMFLCGRTMIPTHNSPLAAGVGHYMLTATKKLRAEVYSAATDKDQAAILFRDAVEMWRRSPELYSRLVPSGQNPIWQLTLIEKASFFKPISSEKKGKSGIRPYCALIDEVHEHPDNSVVEMLRAGTKGNQQALVLEITNSGASRESVCWKEHQYAVKIAERSVENDAFFSYVCALDEDDDPFEDEACWVKANPLLGVTIQPDFVREQVVEAKGMPSKESIVRRLHFCQWTDSMDGWLRRGAWEAVEAELDLERYAGRVCYAGLDLSYTIDLSALAVVFPSDDGLDAFVWFWKPKEGLDEAARKDSVPYHLWRNAGDLELTEGVVIKLAPIAEKLGWLAEHADLKNVAYDKYRHKELESEMADLGIDVPMIEHPQGFRRAGKLSDQSGVRKDENPLWMPKSVEDLENAILEKRIRININRVLRWNVASVAIRHDPAGTANRIFDKKKSTGRIDGLAALAMAVGLAVASPDAEPKYQMFFA